MLNPKKRCTPRIGLRLELSHIEDWCIQVIFRAQKKRVDFNDFSVSSNNISLQIKPETKFLGITLDAVKLPLKPKSRITTYFKKRNIMPIN